MKTRYLLAAASLFIISAFWTESRKPTHQIVAVPPMAGRSVASVVEAPKPAALAAAAAVVPQAAPVIARGVASVDSSEGRVRAMLLKHDPRADWKLDLDEAGRPFKIAGGALPGVLLPGKENSALLMDLQEALGFRAPAAFSRTEKKTGRFQVVDQQQLFVAANGDSIPVYGSYVRYLGNAKGEAFLVQNELRPVDPDLQTVSRLTVAEAIEIARANRDGYEYEVGSPATVIYAHQLPNQRAVQILAKKDGDSRLLVIGEQTRTVVAESRLTMR